MSPDKEAPTPQEVLPEDDAMLGPDGQPLTYDELSDGF